MAELLIGERARPYLKVPPEFSEDGLPWGAFCKCARCGFVARSTGIFDYYNIGGELVCGGCTGADNKTSASIAETVSAANDHENDPLGPGCRGGYHEGLG